jgi:hypothetical protein
VAGKFVHQDLNGGVIDDDPGVFLTPSKWDKPLRLIEGVNKQIVIRNTSLDSTVGMDLTDSPEVKGIVFPLTAPGGTIPIGMVWFEDDGTTVRIKLKRLSGTVVTLMEL